MAILIFHPDINTHKTSNENHIKTYECLSKVKDVKSFEWFLKHPFHKNIDTMFLNWYENTLKNKKNFIQKIQYFVKKLILLFAKARNIKIYYAFHNKTPHNIKKESGLYKKTVRPFMAFCLKKADRVVILSKGSVRYLQKEFPEVELKDKIFYIPHGTYTKHEYDPEELKKKFNLNEGLLFVCLGQISTYKNTDIAVKSFVKANIKGTFLVAGKGDEDYVQKLKEEGNDNVIIYPNFITDEEYSGLMQMADIAVLPYETTSLNSGVMFNAFSNGTSVAGTKIEMMEDFSEELVYGYTYHSKDEHVLELARAMKKAEADYNDGTLKDKGRQLEELIRKDNNWEKIRAVIRGEFV